MWSPEHYAVLKFPFTKVFVYYFWIQPHLEFQEIDTTLILD